LSGTNANAYLLTADLLPISLYEYSLAKYLGNQGNSLMCIQADAMAKDGGGVGRSLNIYTANWAEIQVIGTSVMHASDSPVDPSYTQLVTLQSKFPTTVKGFSFFSNVWEGIKKAARWVKNNEASIISGVQNGVKLAGRLA